MNDLLQFLLAMILPGCVLALGVDTARVLWANRKAREGRDSCRPELRTRETGSGHGARRQECRLSGGHGHA